MRGDVHAAIRKAMVDWLLTEDHPRDIKIYVTGHSMGGALATHCAMDLKVCGANGRVSEAPGDRFGRRQAGGGRGGAGCPPPPVLAGYAVTSRGRRFVLDIICDEVVGCFAHVHDMLALVAALSRDVGTNLKADVMTRQNRSGTSQITLLVNWNVQCKINRPPHLKN